MALEDEMTAEPRRENDPSAAAAADRSAAEEPGPPGGAAEGAVSSREGVEPGGLGGQFGGRFVLRAPLGEGATGRVVRAFDQTRRQEVALKLLHHAEPDSLYRFKQEFRRITGLVHPNVVTLYELVADGDRWGVAMELIDGARSLLDYVRPYEHHLQRPSGLASVSRQYSSRSYGSSVLSVSSEPEPSPSPSATASPRRAAIISAELNLGRLRTGFMQLLDGLEVLHGRGMLHRDIKPSNVLVDRTGRVMVCDFGLVSAVHGPASNIAGTPAYMSPEQTRAGQLTAASDYYSVGVMLYEALTGTLPVTAPTTAELFASKHRAHIRPPSERASGIDSRLEAMCLALLSSTPSARPDAAVVREVLDSLSRWAPGGRKRSEPPGRFIGRRSQTQAIDRALADTRLGPTVAVVISGRSGVGKSALAADACRRMREDHDALVFSGRCYQAESVPFKAVDAVVDAIAEHLVTLRSSAAVELLPPDEELTALCALFPVLRRVEAVTVAIERMAEPIVPTMLRSQAQAGLRRLVETLARARPVVIFIDDLQWGDLDSEPLLRELLEATHTPGALVLATCRRGDRGPPPDPQSDLLAALRRPTMRGLGTARGFRTIELDGLSRAESAELISAVASGRPHAITAADAIIEDAEGDPMYVVELALVAATDGEAAATDGLDALLERKIEGLGTESRYLLEAAAAVAWPQPLSRLSTALDLRDEAAALNELLAARMVTVIAGRDAELITTYHDRVREAASERLSDQRRRRLHRKLARAFERAPEPNFEVLAYHWSVAGDERRTGHYSLRAGQQAFEARAYRRAAEHYARALSSAMLDDTERRAVELARADALFEAGSIRDAAQAYRRLAESVEPAEAIRLRGRALLCLLRASDSEGAAALARSFGRELGVRIPGSTASAISSIAWGRLALAVRKPRIRRLCTPEEIPESIRRRLDVAQSVSGALAFVDTAPGFAVHTRYLRDAIRVGDPVHMCHAMTLESTFLAALRGSAATPDVTAVLAEARRAAEAIEDPAYTDLVDGYLGMCDYVMMTRLRDATAAMDGAADRLDRASAFAWQADLFRLHASQTLGLCGSFAALAERFARLLARSTDTGNDYLRENLIRQTATLLYTAREQPESIRPLLESACPPRGEGREMTVDRWNYEASLAMLTAYEGEWIEAADQMQGLWKTVKGTALSNVLIIRCWTLFLSGVYSTRAAMSQPAQSRVRLGWARRMLAGLERVGRVFGDFGAGRVAVLRAVLSTADGDRAATIEALRQADVSFTACHAMAPGVAVRFERGRLLGGESGAGLSERARECMEQQGVANIPRFVRWHCATDGLGVGPG